MLKIVIASRKSDLARIQAQMVAQKIKKAHPSLEIELRYRESLGDLNQHDPLWKMPEKGVFTQDFRNDLLSGQIDMVVHSWKDLPTETLPGTKVLGALARADQRDLLLVKKSKLSEGVQNRSSALKILSSSPRRGRNLSKSLLKLLPKDFQSLGVEFADIRGNVPTRIRKALADQAADGLVLAKAGIDRLLAAESEEFAQTKMELRQSLAQFSWMILPLSLNPTAAAQGALALEISENRPDLETLLEPILCSKTTAQVKIERAILKQYGGGCHQKIGVSVIDHSLGAVISIQGEQTDGTVLNYFEPLSDYLNIQQPKLIKEYAKEFEILTSPQKDLGLVWSSLSHMNSHQQEIIRSGQWFPSSKTKALKVFERRPLDVDLERLRLKPIMVTRESALPSQFSPGTDQMIWTAGLETWSSLADRGIWVCGTFDSLGEDQLPLGLRAEQLAPEKSGQFVKLTHKSSQMIKESPHFESVLATYELLPSARTETIQVLKDMKWFYWMSGTQFKWAIENNPEIKSALHSCGPGNTLSTLLDYIPRSQIFVYPSYLHWQQSLQKTALLLKGES